MLVDDTGRRAGAPIMRSDPCQLAHGPSLFSRSISENDLRSSTGHSRSRRERSPPRSWMSDSASVAGTLSGELGEGMPKGGRKRTSLSPHMESSDAMREALTYEAPMITELRRPDDPTQIRKQSVSPHLRQRSLSPDRLAKHDIAASQGADGTSLRSGSPLRASWCSSGLSDTGIHALRRGSLVTDVSSTSKVSRMSSVGSVYDPRAKPGSYASEMSKSFCSSLGRKATSGAASEDHLWRELFHEEQDKRVENRLRGEGKAIGSRGVHSNGIPWRQIPSYDANGRMIETGDPFADRKSLQKERGMNEKKSSQFSRKLSPGYGVREIFALQESAAIGEASAACPHADESYLESLMFLKHCLALKYGGNPSPPPPPPTISTQSGETVSSDSSTSNTQPAQSLHFQWKHSKKSNQSSDALKDSCPYHRMDSEGTGTKRVQSPPRHPFLAAPRDISPKSKDEPRIPVEKVVENSRNWKLACDKSRDVARSVTPPRNCTPARNATPMRNLTPPPPRNLTPLRRIPTRQAGGKTIWK